VLLKPNSPQFQAKPQALLRAGSMNPQTFGDGVYAQTFGDWVCAQAFGDWVCAQTFDGWA
jgi:hypothetical protein